MVYFYQGHRTSEGVGKREFPVSEDNRNRGFLWRAPKGARAVSDPPIAGTNQPKAGIFNFQFNNFQLRKAGSFYGGEKNESGN